MTSQEVTNRLTIDATRRAKIISGDKSASSAAFSQLTQGMPQDSVLVAYWRKPQFNVDRSYVIRNSGGLTYVLKGCKTGRCHSLRFFIMPKDSAPKHAGGYRELFS